MKRILFLSICILFHGIAAEAAGRVFRSQYDANDAREDVVSSISKSLALAKERAVNGRRRSDKWVDVNERLRRARLRLESALNDAADRAEERSFSRDLTFRYRYSFKRRQGRANSRRYLFRSRRPSGRLGYRKRRAESTRGQSRRRASSRPSSRRRI